MRCGCDGPARLAIPAVQKPSVHLALAFYLDGPAFFKRELPVQSLPGGVGHMDAPGHAVGFHPAGRVDRVAPQVVEKFALADDAGDDRAGADADADPQLEEALL